VRLELEEVVAELAERPVAPRGGQQHGDVREARAPPVVADERHADLLEEVTAITMRRRKRRRRRNPRRTKRERRAARK